VASDLRQGLITLHPCITSIFPDDQDMANVIEHDPCDEAAWTVVGCYSDSGSIEKAKSEAEQHVARAIEALSSLPDCIERHL